MSESTAVERRYFELQLEEATQRVEAPRRAREILALHRSGARPRGLIEPNSPETGGGKSAGRLLIAAAAAVAVVWFWFSQDNEQDRHTSEPKPAPTGRVEGRVSFPNDVAAFDVEVVAYGRPPLKTSTTRTDESGRFAFPSLAPGLYHFWAEGKDWFQIHRRRKPITSSKYPQPLLRMRNRAVDVVVRAGATQSIQLKTK